MFVQIGLNGRIQTFWVAIFLAAQEAKIRYCRSVQKITQLAQHHTRPIDVTRLKLPHRLDHRQRDLVLV